MKTKQKTLIHWCGLLGVVSFLSYAVAVIFAPSAYPGYDWMSQAVSDLSAANAPSLALWHQLSSLYGVAGIVCVMMVCVAIRGGQSKILQLEIYAFTVMFWVSTIGYAMFPLSESGGTGATFQGTMHIVVTALVVPLSISSFVLVMIGGYAKKRFVSLAVCASVALFLMLVGGIGIGIAPSEYFGVFQRFSNLVSVNGFLAVLGIFLLTGELEDRVHGEV
ncbi:MAG: DUF998 domain-containing protein [Defluviitaleaceae bacterium]|nr:DUF998 domain-containing protein [Defluviitaleaceae bacterium]